MPLKRFAVVPVAVSTSPGEADVTAGQLGGGDDSPAIQNLPKSEPGSVIRKGACEGSNALGAKFRSRLWVSYGCKKY